MRRLLLVAVIGCGLAVPAVVAAVTPASGSSSATFDVIFDDARGLIAGQVVKVAGARAGTIDRVSVTADFKARVQASIDSRFMPFHQDATCTIRPEGLIAENYVECDPGTAASPILTGRPPTVPVRNTTEPVSLLDLFNIFNAPTRERLSIILDELGIGTSGQGQNVNDILRRANPALAYARQAISVLVAQRTQLAQILDATNTVAAQGAAHTRSLQAFLERSAALTRISADHASALSRAIARLPGLLAAAQPALDRLNSVAVNGTPLVNEIHQATPALNTLSERLGPFVTAARPALARLGTALTRAVPAVRDSTPLIGKLMHYLRVSQPSNVQTAQLFRNLQQHGFVENFLGITYYLAALTARYDELGHLGVSYLIAANSGACTLLATTPVPGCSAHYGTVSSAARASTPAASAPPAPAATKAPASAITPAAPSTPTTATTTTAPTATAPPTVAPPSSTAPANPLTHVLQGLLRYLFK